MRVIGRVLLGTLAIFFAMGFIARLIRRRSLYERPVPRRLGVERPRELPAPPREGHTYLAAQPGGSGWGHLVVPPSSPSRGLRRKGRRGAKRLARNSRRGRPVLTAARQRRVRKG